MFPLILMCSLLTCSARELMVCVDNVEPACHATRQHSPGACPPPYIKADYDVMPLMLLLPTAYASSSSSKSVSQSSPLISLNASSPTVFSFTHLQASSLARSSVQMSSVGAGR